METLSKFFKLHLSFFLPLSLITLFLIQSCDMKDLNVQPKGNYIDGYAIFVDSNFMTSGGHYGLALYNNNSSPFFYQPVFVDTINLSELVQGGYYRYTLNWSGTGSYFAAVVWLRNAGGMPLVLGTYGCDTCHTCITNKVIAFPNFTGANYNITCWSDTMKSLY
jgi:hypothetical protein